MQSDDLRDFFIRSSLGSDSPCTNDSPCHQCLTMPPCPARDRFFIRSVGRAFAVGGRADTNYAELVTENLPEAVDLIETFAIRFPGDLELAQLTDLLISKWFQED